MKRKLRHRLCVPLSKHRDFFQRFRIRVAYESTRSYYSWQMLTTADRTIYFDLFPERRAPFLLSRVAVKKLCERYGVRVSRTQSIIGHQESGQPFICSNSILPVGFRCLSVSHAKERALVAVSHQAVGVDVEYMRPDNATWASAFLSPIERAWVLDAMKQMSKADAGKILTVWWSSKEAYLKALGIGLRLHPRQIICYIDWKQESFTIYHHGKLGGIGVFAYESDEYVLAFAVRADEVASKMYGNLRGSGYTVDFRGDEVS